MLKPVHAFIQMGSSDFRVNFHKAKANFHQTKADFIMQKYRSSCEEYTLNSTDTGTGIRYNTYQMRGYAIFQKPQYGDMDITF
jgi:hypothetical protein